MIKDLNKRYTTQYNVSIFANFESIKKAWDQRICKSGGSKVEMQ